MMWLFRFMCLSLVSCLALLACSSNPDVGAACKFALEDSLEKLKTIDNSNDDIRIIEPSFDCELPYCIANFNDPAREGQGYCTRICDNQGDCPRDFSCKPFMQVETLPKAYASLTMLVGKKLCIKNPPTINQ